MHEDGNFERHPILRLPVHSRAENVVSIFPDVRCVQWPDFRRVRTIGRDATKSVFDEFCGHVP